MALKIVDMLIKMMVIFFAIISMTACHRTVVINECHTHLGVMESVATSTHSAQFYLCGNQYYPCHVSQNSLLTNQPIYK